MIPFVYLASPYTPNVTATPLMLAEIRESRYLAACKAAAHLMKQGKVVFAPIAHSHGIDLFFKEPGSGDFWRGQDEPFLEGCSELVVLMLAGWEQSQGVFHEIERARQRGIPVTFMDPL